MLESLHKLVICVFFFSLLFLLLATQPRNSRTNQKTGKKRKQILDEETQLSGASFKSQLLNTSDIVKGLDLAPPTKQVMEYTSTIDSDTLFGFPGRPHSSQQLLNVSVSQCFMLRFYGEPNQTQMK